MAATLIPFGINEIGKLVAVEEVARGLACQCFVPAVAAL